MTSDHVIDETNWMYDDDHSIVLCGHRNDHILDDLVYQLTYNYEFDRQEIMRMKPLYVRVGHTSRLLINKSFFQQLSKHQQTALLSFCQGFVAGK